MRLRLIGEAEQRTASQAGGGCLLTFQTGWRSPILHRPTFLRRNKGFASAVPLVSETQVRDASGVFFTAVLDQSAK